MWMNLWQIIDKILAHKAHQHPLQTLSLLVYTEICSDLHVNVVPADLQYRISTTGGYWMGCVNLFLSFYNNEFY